MGGTKESSGRRRPGTALRATLFGALGLLAGALPVTARTVETPIAESVATKSRDEIAWQGFVLTRSGTRFTLWGDVEHARLAESEDAGTLLADALQRLARSGGGRIEIRQGRFPIGRSLEVPANVSIIGAGRATVFEMTPALAQAGGAIFQARQADRIVLADFACVGAPGAPEASAIVLDGCGASIVRSVMAHRFPGCGVWLKGHSFANRLEDIFTSRNGRAGILIGQTSNGRGGRFVPNLISGCISYAEDGHGFEFDGAICQNLVNCTAYLPRGDGIYMHGSTSNLITGCRVFMGARNGITLRNTHELNITANIVGWNSGENLLLDHCVWGTVTGNEFIDAGGRKAPQVSVHLRRGTKSVQVTANALFNWHDNQIMAGGVLEEADCLENQITNNVINYYRDFPVLSQGANSVANFNLALPHAYGSPSAPNVPNVKPEDIKLHLDIDDSRAKAEQIVDAWFAH